MDQAKTLCALALLAAIGWSGNALAGAAADDASCRCMLTFSAGGAREQYCDGFDPGSHRRCECTKTTNAAGSPMCVPKGSAPIEPPIRSSNRDPRERH